jgi:DNA-binding transcriptional regulator PaaX
MFPSSFDSSGQYVSIISQSGNVWKILVVSIDGAKTWLLADDCGESAWATFCSLAGGVMQPNDGG